MKLLRHACCILGLAVMARAQSLNVTPSATTYAATGGSVTMAVTMTYPGEASALGFEIGGAPAGWSFGSIVGGNVPQVRPFAGATGAFEFAYTSIPPSPVTLTFSVNYPAGLTGNQSFTGISANFRLGGSPVIANAAAIVLTAGSGGGTPPVVVAPAITLSPVGASLTEGDTYTLSVVVSGTPPLAYQWQRNGVAVAGATAASLALTKVVPAAAGTYAVVVTNSAGSVTSTGAIITVKGATAATPPQITVQPASAALSAGGSVLLAVTATGTAPLTYQWRKDGVALAGASNASLVLTNVQAGSAGSYAVVVTNAAGSVTSAPATLSVKAGTPPQIGVQPASQTALVGARAVFTVLATGEPPLSYQWRKDGTALAGATEATLVVSSVSASSGGNYSVGVSNAAGSVASAAAVLTVRPAGLAGTYFGNFPGGGGSFALLVRADRSARFVAYANAARAAVVSRSIVVDGEGRFSVDVPASVNPRSPPAGGPPVAAQEGVYRVAGAIAADGALTGTIPALNLAFSAPSATVAGLSAGVAGYYQSGAAGSSAVSYAILGPAGDAMVVAIVGTTADGGRGTVDSAGTFAVTTAANARIVGKVGTDYVVTSTLSPATGTAVTFLGANPDARTESEKLVNISTRSRTGTATDSLIAGFIVTGSASKPVLVRAIGPSLATFGVTGTLEAARLEVFREGVSVAVGNNWGEAAVGANEAADAAARVGAFALARGSRDAALVLNLDPGAYTAVVTGQQGAAGVALVEVYDATAGPIPPAQRIINLATRSRAGAGDGALIAGFVINGTMPKRLLVRGAGPALAQFGVADVLARPQLAVYSGSAVLARNTGWGDSTDVAAITVAAAQAGAFAFPVASADTAILINLAPGAYTAQLSGAAGTTGNALIEIYELP